MAPKALYFPHYEARTSVDGKILHSIIETYKITLNPFKINNIQHTRGVKLGKKGKKMVKKGEI